MKLPFLTLAASLAVIALTLGSATVISDTPSSPVSSRQETTAAVENMASAEVETGEAAEVENLEPEDTEAVVLEIGSTVPANFPHTNDWGWSAWIFWEVSIPLLSSSAVQLDPTFIPSSTPSLISTGEKDGAEADKGDTDERGEMEDWIPVITFTPSPGWTLIEEEVVENVLHTVWFYESGPVDEGMQYPPLISEISMPNFKVTNGWCGEVPWCTIACAVGKVTITRYALMGGLEGTGLELWRLVR